tara:strand:+ start:920 stop:1702 length:783 start_codon:yes stop_codon:yes gene_type:complete
MVKTLNENKESNFLVICDHASNYIPENYRNLGLPRDTLDTHIAYDIGAKELASNISTSLQCPLVMSDFSRLLIDPNRGVDDPTLIMKISDGNIIAGNKNISFLFNCEEKKKRIDNYYNLYHKKISEIIKRSIKNKIFPSIISIHSFTPLFSGKKRKTELGILWDKDNRLPDIFFKYLKDETNLIIGDNEPYVGYLKNDSLYQHATSEGLSNILIEVRQDLINDTKSQKKIAQIISKPLLKNINNSSLFKQSIFGSRVDLK